MPNVNVIVGVSLISQALTFEARI